LIKTQKKYASNDQRVWGNDWRSPTKEWEILGTTNAAGLKPSSKKRKEKNAVKNGGQKPRRSYPSWVRKFNSRRKRSQGKSTKDGTLGGSSEGLGVASLKKEKENKTRTARGELKTKKTAYFGSVKGKKKKALE